MYYNTRPMSEMTDQELILYHNDVRPEEAIGHWSGRRATLVRRIRAARAECYRGYHGRPTIRQAIIELLSHIDFYEDKSLDPAPDNVVDKDHPNAGSVGLPYVTIHKIIREEFGRECRTSLSDIRGHARKMRIEESGYIGTQLPRRRPRSRIKGAK